VASAGNERRAALAAVDVALNRIGGDQQVLVVPADDARANSFAADLAEQLSNAIVYSPRSGDTVPSNGSKAIVVAAAGRTHADDVTRTNEYLRALGCVVVGSVLGDVAPRDLRRAMA
jgi:GGDEF domain-containing protein